MAHGSTAGNHKEYEGERTASTNDRYHKRCTKTGNCLSNPNISDL